MEAGWQIILAQCAKKCAKLLVPKFLAHVPKIKCVKLIVPKNKSAKINVPKFLAHLFLAHFL